MLDKLRYAIGDAIRARQIAAAEGGTNEKKQRGGKHRKPVHCTAKKRHTIKGSKHMDHECIFEPDPGNPNGECGREHLCLYWHLGCDYRWT